jgi:hypothetical protein
MAGIIKTGREDITLETAPGTAGELVRLVVIGKFGDQTAKVLTQDEAIDLARALLTAAGMPSPFAF